MADSGAFGALPTTKAAVLAEMEALQAHMDAIELELIHEDAGVAESGGVADNIDGEDGADAGAGVEVVGGGAGGRAGDGDGGSVWTPPAKCIPICADVRVFDFKALGEAQRRLTGRGFDVIMMDPPWQLASANPTRGVTIGYEQLGDAHIRDLPLADLQSSGLLFVWVINAKYRFALRLLDEWGYKLVDDVAWVKQTVNRRLAKSHGYYLQHAKETCLVGLKGELPPGTVTCAASDVLFSRRRGQSQKPTEVYQLIEELVPGGYFLEIFGRRNNLRDHWVTIGNEL